MPAHSRFSSFLSMLLSVSLLSSTLLLPIAASAQESEVTGSFIGRVTGPNGSPPISGAKVTIINNETGIQRTKFTDSNGEFKQGALPSGTYTIVVEAANYARSSTPHRLFVTKPNQVEPVPIELTPLSGNTQAVTTPSPSASPGTQPNVTPTPGTGQTITQNQTQGGPVSPTTQEDVKVSPYSTSDARRGGAFSDKEVSTLPLGSRTLTRTFDELALLLPGVTLPPLTIGNGSGPGQGAGVGSAGQFSVNGMRSRSNNFTVDGSDNNDEDIGVRRQGFFSLVPQPIESIQEYQVTTLLAPAQYGRNFGAQVNAVSKSGGNDFHGTIYGFFNSSQLNARDFFDTANGTGTSNVTARTTFGGTTFVQPVRVASTFGGATTPLTVTNQSGGEDSFTLGQGGFVFGGPLKRDTTFFFASYERQVLNAVKEASFAVPTVEQRGIFGMGATGVFADCLTPGRIGFGLTNCNATTSGNFFPELGFPATFQGNAVFSLFPFPNNPGGVYGINTYTQTLPASARGNVASAKIDHTFNLFDRSHTFTARYNFTQDWRILPVTGGALFSSLKPDVRTQNFSTFLTSELSNRMNNVLRISYGRTRLDFAEVRDPFLIPSQESPDEPFLLNTNLLFNATFTPNPIPGGVFGITGVPNTGPVTFLSGLGTTEDELGRVGQINVAGFSPIGVDVNNFPQNRVNNTYQLADVLGYQVGRHSLAFGVDLRRVALYSDLPRNSRTLLTFNGAPEFDFSTFDFSGAFLNGTDLVAAGAPSGAFLSVSNGVSSAIGLRYYELNFFGQDTWRIRPNLSLNFGLRYEYNTPPKETNNLIEQTFTDPALNNANAAGLKRFYDGRTRIFDPDKNNFEPRIGLAWSPSWFGSNRRTVIRAGFGVYHDPILGAVVSQSRNVFPNFITVNTGTLDLGGGFLEYFNPARGGILNAAGVFVPLIQPGTLNTLNSNLTVAQVLNVFSSGTFFPNAVAVTLPERRLKTPSAEQYGVTIEQQINSNMLISAAYIATRGHNLLRGSTPNLGPNNFVLPLAVFAGVDDPACYPVFTAGCTFGSLVPSFSAFAGAPGNESTDFDRPIANVGPVFIYEGAGYSRYDAFQLQLRGRFTRGLQYQASYTLADSKDDVSDVFDLAGAPALPQNSLTRAGEYAASNFDVRHRIAYNMIYDFPSSNGHGGFYKAIFGGLQIASSGFFQTGQPFTVNSIYDVNLDGNLTDRLDTTQGLVLTNDRRQPIVIGPNTNRSSLIATPGTDGRVGRNSFRAGNILNLDLAIVKNFTIKERQKLIFRMDIFNFINRANFGIPVRFLEAPGFGQAVDTVTPGRRIQFALKYSF